LHIKGLVYCMNVYVCVCEYVCVRTNQSPRLQSPLSPTTKKTIRPLLSFAPNTIPDIWVVGVSLALFFLLFTHFTILQGELFKAPTTTLSLMFSLLWFENMYLFSSLLARWWQLTCVLQDVWHFNESAILGCVPSLASLPFLKEKNTEN